LISEFDPENKNFTCRIDRNHYAEISIKKCSWCGRAAVVVMHIADTSLIGTYEGHVRWSKPTYIAGMRTKEGHLLCDRCAGSSELYDKVRSLREKEQEARTALKEISQRIDGLKREIDEILTLE